MVGELDSILIRTECPRCGRMLHATYGHLRINPALGCSCGAMIKLDFAETGIDKVQQLIEEANPQQAVND